MIMLIDFSMLNQPCIPLGCCDTVIYNEKYVFDLCPYFWSRAPKILGIS